ncbi:orotidine-5'-phosphate decarboxylase [Gemmatimonas sp.]|uniref:orotidine-5'-phosphate decarboxylase n=1 Tax=Gemmatimonas sp. TaxID=1962908 RepID=UPI0022C52D3E|nr:orotidine-5'-phosphate decarboxylase [Gemmatimonas sp.]MCZ8203687.1 orotidine-5'-phosphate decarboxylase [Gemmatimonas sp.]
MALLTASAAIPIVALDVPDRAGAEAVVRRLGDACGFYKVGLELFSAEGPAIVSWLRGLGKEVFVDLKLHDIPNTVRGAARSVARHGAALLTVHASGGREMIAAAVEGAREGRPDGGCGILGVTILTSMDATGVESAWGRTGVTVQDEVLRLAGLVAEGQGTGIVCSGHEADAVRGKFGGRLGLLIPGIRLPGGEAHDQRRVMTPAAAAEAGARWLILGRAVTAAADPVAAMAEVNQSLAGIS